MANINTSMKLIKKGIKINHHNMNKPVAFNQQQMEAGRLILIAMLKHHIHVLRDNAYYNILRFVSDHYVKTGVPMAVTNSDINFGNIKMFRNAIRRLIRYIGKGDRYATRKLISLYSDWEVTAEMEKFGFIHPSARSIWEDNKNMTGVDHESIFAAPRVIVYDDLSHGEYDTRGFWPLVTIPNELGYFEGRFFTEFAYLFREFD